MELLVNYRRTGTARFRSITRTRVLVGLATAACIGTAPPLLTREASAHVVAVPAGRPAPASVEPGYAQGGQPATRRSVRPAVPADSLPGALSAAIGEMVKSVNGCTQTVVGSTTVTAAHCHPAGFRVEGDVAWSGPRPVWTDPAVLAVGSTIYAVGYPIAAPGPQSFALTALGIQRVSMEGRSIEVMMAFGNGVPCTPGASGMIGWVTLNNQMVPIGPLSVYSTNPAITGLPVDQYVCGFAV